MFKIYLKALYEKKWLFLSLLFFGILFIWMYVSLFKTIAQVVSIEELLKILPEKVIKSFNIDVRALNTFEGFIGSEKFSVLLIILTTILGISFGSTAISGEIEKSTIYLPLSLPFKRASFYLSKLLAGMTAMIAFGGLTILSTIPQAKLYDISIHADRFVKFSLISILFGLTVFAFSMFLSSIFSERNNVAFITGGVLVVMYVLNLAANIKDSLNYLKYFSVFHYINITDILVKNTIDSRTWFVFIGSFIIFSILGMLWFQKRDLNFQ